jgi:hypothetical protein
MQPLRIEEIQTVPGEYYGTPKELWGFSIETEKRPLAAARQFVRANAELLGVAGQLDALERRQIVHGLGATHVILQQIYRGARVHRGFITVHIGRGGRIYLVKNRAVPSRLLGGEPGFVISRARAIECALGAIRRTARSARVVGIERRWFPRKRKLIPTLRVRIRNKSPREDWIVYVHAEKGTLVSRWDNLALGAGVARVFDPNPVVALGDHRPLLIGGEPDPNPASKTYRRVRLRDLTLTGRLDGERVSTRLTPGRVRHPEHQFLYRRGVRGFDEAMVYHHIDTAVRYLESLGYAGQRRIFRAPILVNAHATQEDNSWYEPSSKTLSFGAGGVPDAEDGETILHELGHAIQDAICPDFGQSVEAMAMGEGFGDYFAASFFARRKRGRYRAAVMSWDAITFPDFDPPCLRRLDGDLRYDAFDPKGDEHDNGVIWSATLWDVFCALGRRVADRLIIDSHFQLDGFTSFARAARAMLDADQNLYRGRHRAALRRIFRRRKIAL